MISYEISLQWAANIIKRDHIIQLPLYIKIIFF